MQINFYWLQFAGATFEVPPAVWLLAIVLWILSILWSYGDAGSRGKSGCLVAILVAFLAWPIGLIVWLIFRPEATDAKPRLWPTATIACSCGRRIPLTEGMAGSKLTCPSCGAEIVVPELSRLRDVTVDRNV